MVLVIMSARANIREPAQTAPNEQSDRVHSVYFHNKIEYMQQA